MGLTILAKSSSLWPADGVPIAVATQQPLPQPAGLEVKAPEKGQEQQQQQQQQQEQGEKEQQQEQQQVKEDEVYTDGGYVEVSASKLVTCTDGTWTCIRNRGVCPIACGPMDT